MRNSVIYTKFTTTPRKQQTKVGLQNDIEKAAEPICCPILKGCWQLLRCLYKYSISSLNMQKRKYKECIIFPYSGVQLYLIRSIKAWIWFCMLYICWWSHCVLCVYQLTSWSQMNCRRLCFFYLPFSLPCLTSVESSRASCWARPTSTRSHGPTTRPSVQRPCTAGSSWASPSSGSTASTSSRTSWSRTSTASSTGHLISSTRPSGAAEIWIRWIFFILTNISRQFLSTF